MLFKAALNTSMGEIKQYLSVSQNGSFDKIRPHIAAAEILYIREILGNPLYEALNSYYNEGFKGPVTGEQMAYPDLLPLVQRPLIHFAYYIGADEFGLHITDSGMQIITDETHKQAFQWQIEAAKSSWLGKAYLFTDILLEYLESNKTTFVTWAESDAYTDRIDALLYTTKQFNDAVFIRNSRRLFLAMKPIISSIEQKYVIPTISREYYEDLIKKERFIDPPSGQYPPLGSVSLLKEDEDLLLMLRPAIANLAMAEAITRFSLEVFPEGVYSNMISSFGTINGKNPSGKMEKAVAIDSLTADGHAGIQAVQKYLDANASAQKYPLYFASSRYASPMDKPYRSEFSNSADSGILLL